MAIVITSLGTATGAGGGSVSLSATVPGGSFIFVGTVEEGGTTAAGSVADDVGNIYSKDISSAINNSNAQGWGGCFHTYNCTSLTTQNITYTKTTAGVRTRISAFYAIGLLTASDPIDLAVSQSAFGNSNTPSVTSGIPTAGDELFVGTVTLGGNDTINAVPGGWTLHPPDLSSGGGVSVEGCYIIDSAGTAQTFNPTTFGVNTWAAFVVGFKPQSIPETEVPFRLPFAEVPRPKINPALAVALIAASGVMAPVFIPIASVVDRFESSFHQPWSEPVRLRRFPTSEQQVLAFVAIPPPEVITSDKWYAWLSEPVRQKKGLDARLQQFSIQTVLEPETQIISKLESRWHYAWSEPVRFRTFQTQQQLAFTFTAIPPPEVLTLDKWYQHFSEPVRFKPALKASLQQAFIAPVLNPNTQITNVFESRWHYAWTEPVRFRRFPVSEQMALAFTAIVPPEISSLDKWYQWWTEPVRFKVGLAARFQQETYGSYQPILNSVSFTFSAVEINTDSASFGFMIGLPPVLQPLTAIVSVEEIEVRNEGAASIEES